VVPAFIAEDVALRPSRQQYATGGAHFHSNALPHGPHPEHIWPWPVLSYCSGHWTYTKFDLNNCGACGHKCAVNENCCEGICVPRLQNCSSCGDICAENMACCAQSDGTFKCIDVVSDPDNCGSCNNQCAYGLPGPLSPFIVGCCDQGVCIPASDFAFDSSNCGGCGIVCKPGELCSSGHCCSNCWTYYPGGRGSFFPAGCYPCSDLNKIPHWKAACCDGFNCVNLNSDVDNCGRCGNECSAWLGNSVCIKGKCECPPGSPTKCRDTCANLYKDKENCGACGNICQQNEECCNGNCVDILSDCRFCGSCEAEDCPCIDSFIEGSPTKHACCSGKCVELLSDSRNCGSCGIKCSEGFVCGNGQCLPIIIQ
jgi:hypothetical protein